MKCGTVALVGRPNVGKSTLVNALLKTKVAIVSPKPQTTRNAIRCVYNTSERGGAQIIFTDTPGIHIPKDKLGAGLVNAAVDAIDAADVVCWIVDADDMSAEDEHIISVLKETDKPIILVLNKTDLAKKRQKIMSAGLEFVAVIPVSAKKNENLDALISAILPFIQDGPAWFDPDVLIDSTERFLAAELIREQILKYLRDEVPHCVAVEIDDYKSPDEYPDKKKLYISARLITETEGQKKILIGEGGSMIRKVGQAARIEIEKSSGHPVYLELRVQARPKWRESQTILKRLGYA